MMVSVRMFARARDLTGASLVRLELAPGSSVADLRRALASSYPALASLLTHSALAVENELAEEDRVLKPEEEIALLPPVSGG